MYSDQFQTLPIVAKYMVDFLPNKCGIILEPTPGTGNLVKEAKRKGKVIAPNKFEDLPKNRKYDWVIMNPPFTPMQLGFEYLLKIMDLTDNIIALLPWLIIINSQKRIDCIKKFGLVSITNLPRKAFPKSRVQCCILELKKGYNKETIFKSFSW